MARISIGSSASTCSYQINYAYDGLGRTNSRTVSGAGAETFQYDAIGRLTGHTNDLGSFALAYLGQTAQVTQRQLLPVSSNMTTSWSYLANTGDRRLAGIDNVGLSSSQFSNYQFTTTPKNFISAITETADTAIAYPSPSTQTASYNNLNQLTVLSGQALSYDANGNLLADGQRNYTWDAENRLIGITYPGQSGKQTAFTYDGRGRRTAIVSTPAGGSAVTTAYVWCGARICQARNASNATTREYYGEGEFVPGSPAQPYYYGVDQLGSVRRAFASVGSAPAFSYDPYGNRLQATAPLTDFGYARMFYNADSGLYLTNYRAYDPVAGRWLSRDPIGETDNPASSELASDPMRARGQINLYAYVAGNPITFRDPTGLLGEGASFDRFASGVMCMSDAERAALAAGGLAALGLGVGGAALLGDLAPAIAASEGPFTPAETAGLRELFGKGPEGAQALLDQLSQGSVDLPPNVTAQTLEKYAEIAQSAIDRGRDIIGTQALRLQALMRLLK